MERSHREMIKHKNNDYWTLRNNPHVLVCKKCKKYNTIINSQKVINCSYCGSLNYTAK